MRPLADVKTQAIQDWKEDERQKNLIAIAHKLAERGNGGESIEKLAADVHGKVETTDQIRRSDSSDALSANAIAALFAVPKDGFSIGPSTKGDNVVLIQARDVVNLAVDPSLKSYQTLQPKVQESLEQDVFMTLVSAWQSEFKVTINNTLLEQMAASEGAQ